MNRLHKIGILAVCMIFGVLLCETGRAELVDRIVANVNGQIILYSDLQHQIAVLKKRMPTLDLTDPEQKSKVEHEVLEQMVQQKLADMEAKRLKITVSDSEINARIGELMKMNHLTPEQLQASLKANGDTLAKLRKQIKENIARQELVQRVLKSQVIISDQEIDAYLKWRQTQSSQDAQEANSTNKMHLALIMLPVGGANGGSSAEARKTGAKLVKELQGGADFGALAKQYSKGPAAQQGGDVGYMEPEDIAPFIAKAIHGMKKGQVSDLVQGPDGYYLVKILDVGSHPTNIASSTSREKVRQILYEQAMNRKYEQWLKNLESKAFIQISL
ncbi:MAG: SurA N-terminal domain-containing protein [Syntrophobacteraceae bacterium]|nr:SurA N-terminal domain-containing protein [Syntrophobacteraceae bacterium]